MDRSTDTDGYTDSNMISQASFYFFTTSKLKSYYEEYQTPTVVYRSLYSVEFSAG
jgi:hypothetical protein